MHRFVLIALLVPFCLVSQEKYVFEGTIGKSAIWLFFNDYVSDDGSIEARYFYKSQLKDIVLEGKTSANGLTLIVGNHRMASPAETFFLTRNGDDFKGVWQDSLGHKLPVSLKLLDEKTIRRRYSKTAAGRLPEIENQDLIRAQFLNFKRDSVQQYNGKSFEWLSENHCSSPFFRLGNGFSQATKNTINPILETLHYEMTLWQLACPSQVFYADGQGIDYATTITYLDDNLLGIDKFSYWYCGGAHPDGGHDGVLLDLHSGKRYEIDDIYAFDKSATTEEKGGFDAYVKYREQYFGPAIYNLINQTKHFAAPKETDVDQCDFTGLDHWNFVGWIITEKGIEITPSFPHAMQPCREPFLIPFEKLERYRNPSFPYKLGSEK